MSRDGHEGSIMTGRHTALIPLRRSDYEFVYQLEALGPLATRYRFRGVTPNPERFHEMIWSGVLTQHVIIWRKSGNRIGTAVSYSADFRNRHVRFGGALIQDSSPYTLEAFVLLVDHLFDEFDFRKIYGDSLDVNSSATRSAIGPLMHEEGRLRQHEYIGGQYCDLLTLALYREEWMKVRESSGDENLLVHERLSALRRGATSADITTSPLAERLRAAIRAKETPEGVTRNG